MGLRDGEWAVMKRKPQIFDRLQKQKEPVSPEMLDILKSDEGTMKGIMEQWRTHLKEYDEAIKKL